MTRRPGDRAGCAGSGLCDRPQAGWCWGYAPAAPREPADTPPGYAAAGRDRGEKETIRPRRARYPTTPPVRWAVPRLCHRPGPRCNRASRCACAAPVRSAGDADSRWGPPTDGRPVLPVSVRFHGREKRSAMHHLEDAPPTSSAGAARARSTAANAAGPDNGHESRRLSTAQDKSTKTPVPRP